MLARFSASFQLMIVSFSYLDSFLIQILLILGVRFQHTQAALETAVLDPIAESKMYERFANVLSKRGAIMISHRLASAKMADKIFVFSGGTVAEEGTHEELLKKGGLYHDMWEKQSSWYVTKEA